MTENRRVSASSRSSAEKLVRASPASTIFPGISRLLGDKTGVGAVTGIILYEGDSLADGKVGLSFRTSVLCAERNLGEPRGASRFCDALIARLARFLISSPESPA